jgi:hypothetical protein
VEQDAASATSEENARLEQLQVVTGQENAALQQEVTRLEREKVEVEAKYKAKMAAAKVKKDNLQA